MDPATLIPVPDALPVHWFWFQLLLTVTTFLHLVAMNIVLGSSGLAFISTFSTDSNSLNLGKEIGHKLPFVLAFTINFGVAPLLFLQTLYGQFFYTSTVLMASLWLSIIGMLIVTYYAAYIFHLRFDSLARFRAFFIGLAVVLLLIISFFFTNNISLMQMPSSWTSYFSSPNGWLVNWGDITLLPRYLHFIVSGFAVGSLAVALLYEFKKRRGDVAADAWIKLGCKWFTIGTVINFGIGFWFLGTLPGFAHDVTTSAGKLFTIVLYGSVAAGAVSVIKAMSNRVVPAAIWTMATVFLMVIARDMVRISYLHPYLSLPELPVKTQYSPFILFLIFFAGIGALVWWMLKTAWCAKEVQ
ncbi:MAG: hypothetical protein KQH63_02380 [Desulfobulbaceae bacterium]|nr:hypothetical protein [Desulfobulbaceae bacterium]